MHRMISNMGFYSLLHEHTSSSEMSAALLRWRRASGLIVHDLIPPLVLTGRVFSIFLSQSDSDSQNGVTYLFTQSREKL